MTGDRISRALTPVEIIERQVLDDLHGDASGFDAQRVYDALINYGYRIIDPREIAAVMSADLQRRYER